jgi:hypothetical protein
MSVTSSVVISSCCSERRSLWGNFVWELMCRITSHLSKPVRLNVISLDFRELVYIPLTCDSSVQGQVYLPTCEFRPLCEQARIASSVFSAPISADGTFSFQTSSKEGAALITNFSTYVTNAQQEQRFLNYIKRYSRTWARWARDQGHAVSTEDIRLVTGHDLTQDFAMFAYSGDTERQLNLEFRAGAPIMLSTSAYVWGRWNFDSSAHYNHGPQRLEPPASVEQFPLLEERSSHDATPSIDYSQCVFLRSYRIRYRSRLWPKILKAGAEPNDTDNSGNNDDADRSFHTSQESETSDENDTYEVLKDTIPVCFIFHTSVRGFTRRGIVGGPYGPGI